MRAHGLTQTAIADALTRRHPDAARGDRFHQPNYPILMPRDCIGELDALQLDPDARRRYLSTMQSTCSAPGRRCLAVVR